MQAMILGVFTNGYALETIITPLAAKLKIDEEKLREMISKFMANETPVYTEWGNQKIAFPKNVLIQVDENDFETIDYDFSMEDLQCGTVNLTPDRNHKAPHSALWMLSTACATNCKYCYADRKTPHIPLSTEKILEIIDDLHRLKVQYVDVIGGEIFMCKDWDVIIKRLVDYDMAPTYISTKMPVTPVIAERLKNSGYRNVVQFSLDSLSDSVLSDLIGTKSGYVEKIKQGIALLEQLGFPIQIDTILTSKTADIDEINILHEYIKTIKNLNTWEIRVPEYSLYSPETFREVQAPVGILRMVQKHVTENIKAHSKQNIVFSSEAIDQKFRQDGPEVACFKGGLCGILQQRVFILPDGKVSVCEQMYWHKDFIIGDLSRQSMSEIWNSPKAMEIFRQPEEMFRDKSKCRSCKAFSECRKNKRRCVVKVVKAYGLENWDYPDPRCKFAPVITTELKYK